MKNTFLKFRCQYDDFVAFQWDQGGMKSPTHALSNHDIKIGGRDSSEQLFRFKKWHVLALYCP